MFFSFINTQIYDKAEEKIAQRYYISIYAQVAACVLFPFPSLIIVMIRNLFSPSVLSILQHYMTQDNGPF